MRCEPSWEALETPSFVTLTGQNCRATMTSMSTCPSCNQKIATPNMFNLQGWAEFVCPHCRARLEAKPPRSGMLATTMPFLFGLGREGRVFEVVAIVFAIGVFTAFLIEAAHPKLRFKKPLPEPAIRLNIVEGQH